LQANKAALDKGYEQSEIEHFVVKVDETLVDRIA
jgi:hypothetical protein